MKKAFLFISVFVLIASTLACSLSSLTGPYRVVTLAPASGKQWDEANMAEARDVILSRLKSIGVVGATASVSSDGNLQINLPTSANLESVAPLLTGMGEITFVDSTSPFSEGVTVDPDLKIIMTGSDIKSAEVTSDAFGQYQIDITFTPEGSQKMADYSSNNIGHYLIIARDGIVITAPTIYAAITGGNAIIQGSFTQESAIILAVQLKSGTLPFPLIILDTAAK